jgi:hypothetical protein
MVRDAIQLLSFLGGAELSSTNSVMHVVEEGVGLSIPRPAHVPLAVGAAIRQASCRWPSSTTWVVPGGGILFDFVLLHRQHSV